MRNHAFFVTMGTMWNNYAEFYEEITAKFQSVAAKKRLNAFNILLTNIFNVAYPCLFLTVFFFQRNKFSKILLIPAISFTLLSLVRKELNCPRPYEKDAIIPLIAKDTKGDSMPSRHVFSAVIIAMAFLYILPWLGIVLLILAAMSGCIRILGGVHYPWDVAVGYLCGICCGLLFFAL